MKIVEIMSPDPITVDASDALVQALSTLEELDIRHLPVLRDGRVVGVISDRDLLESTGWMWDEKRGKAPVAVQDILQPEPMIVGPDEPVATLAARLVEWGVGCAPVVESGSLLGIATEIDVLRSFSASPPESPSPRIETRMATDVVSLDVTANAAEALTLMRDRAIRHLPIVDGLRVVGLVSDRDVRAVLGRALPGTTPVREFMSTDVQTISPDDDLTEAARLMSRLKIGCLPVVDREDLVGMITVTDLLEHCASVLG
jgi:CBS domain-containing protein